MCFDRHRRARGAGGGRRARARGGAQELADRNSERFKALAPRIDASNDFFIRTTDPQHMAVVQEVLTKVRDNGHVYMGTYEGWYCPSAPISRRRRSGRGELVPDPPR